MTDQAADPALPIRVDQEITVFTLSTLIIIAIATLLVGVAVGALLVKSMNPGEQRNRELEARLKQTEEQLRDYQQDVAAHFAETSQRVNSLTQSYKEVHQHLAASALKLSNPDLSRQLIEAGDGKLLNDSRKRTDAAADGNSEATAPRDWAPRAAHGKGQLSEDFGLDTDHETPEDTGHYNPATQRGVL